MSFFPEVERWRTLVRQVLGELLSVSSTYSALLQTMNLPFDYVVDLILGIIQKESSGNPDAIGDNGNSIGLMQLNFAAGTPQSFGYTDKEKLKDPYTNITVGSLYFLQQLNRYRDVAKALSAYNAGHAISGNLENYVNKIFDFVGEKKT